MRTCQLPYNTTHTRHGTITAKATTPLTAQCSLPLSTQFVRPSVGLSFLAFSFHSKPTITYDLTESAPALSQNLIPSNFLQTRTASLDLHEPVAGIGALILKLIVHRSHAPQHSKLDWLDCWHLANAAAALGLCICMRRWR